MKYLHPNVESRVIDNSFVAVTADGSTTILAPIFSSKGKDNTIEGYTALSNYIEHYGNLDLYKYGLGGYIAAEHIRAGGTALVCRLMPDEAKYANLFLKVKVAEDANGTTVTPYLRSESSNVSNLDSMRKSMRVSADVETDATTGATTGKVYTLGAFLPYGRGTGYNYHIRIDYNTALSDTYNFRMYSIHVTTKNESNDDVYLESFDVSLYPGARDRSRNSLYFVDVINKYSQHIQCVGPTLDVKDNGFNAVVEHLHALAQDDTIDPLQIDVLAGNVNEKVYRTKDDGLGGTITTDVYDWKLRSLENVTYNTSSETETGIFQANGFHKLDGGFDANVEDPAVQEQLLIQFFSGAKFPQILDKLDNEIDLVIDAGYTTNVKFAIHEFVKVRQDCMAILDCGTAHANSKQTLDYRKNDLNMSSYLTAIFAQDGETFDSYTGTNIRVPATYKLASKIVETDNSFGVHYPFVGPRRGIVENFKNLNFIPNEYEREALHTAKINYIERDPRKMNFGNQITSQAQNSALSDISHVRTLLKIRRNVERIAAEYRMEFNDSTTLEALSYDLNQYLKTWTGNRACQECSAVVSATEYQKLQRIAQIVVNIRFTGILERVQIDLVVGK